MTMWSATEQYTSGRVVLSGGSLTAYRLPIIKFTEFGGNITLGGSMTTKMMNNFQPGPLSARALSGTTLLGASVQSGNTVTLDYASILSGTVNVLSGGSLSIGGRTFAQTTVMKGATLNLVDGSSQWELAANIISGGTLNTWRDPYITYTSAGGVINLQSGCGATDIAGPMVSGLTTVNIMSGATLTSGTSLASVNVMSGNVINVSKGGTVSGAYALHTGAVMNVSGTTAGAVNVNPGATYNLFSGAQQSVVYSVTTLSGGVINASTDPRATYTSTGGTMNLIGVSNATTTTNLVAGNTTVNLVSGTNASDARLRTGNVMYVDGASSLTGTASVDSGAKLTVAGKINGAVNLANGGTLVINATAGGSVAMLGSTNAGLLISGLASGGTLTTQIISFDGVAPGNSDGIQIAGVKAADVASVSYPDDDHVVFTLKNGKVITLNIVGAKAAGYSLSDSSAGNLMYETCFLAGNMIATPDGLRAIETLNVGDRVSVFEKDSRKTGTRTILWAGQKTVYTPSSATLGTATDRGAFPVRILKDAFAPDTPSQDMLITPEHCLCLDGRLVPARMLVNDRSIFYDRSFESYTYYHIETKDHCLIWANNVLTETYLDTGNRMMFDDVQSDFTPDAHGQSVVLLDVSIGFVQPLHQAILDRAIVQGVAAREVDPVLTGDPGLYLLTDRGTVLENRSTNPGVAKFALPSGVHSVRLVSRSARPCDTLGPFVDDRRRLGILVGGITLFSSQTAVDITTHLSRDFPGWHTCEHGPVRWTDGFAFLPLPQDSVTHGSSLAIEVHAVTVYRLEEEEPAALSA